MKNPKLEAAERAAETYPALSAAAAAVGLQDHRQSLNSHQSRVADSHKAQMKALGLEASQAGDEMGDIVITGDIHSQDPAKVIGSLKGESMPSQVTKSSPLKTAALIATAALGGSAAPYLLPLVNSLVNPSVQSQPDSGIVKPSSSTTVENDYPMKIYRD